jgi:hypothetical protein
MRDMKYIIEVQTKSDALIHGFTNYREAPLPQRDQVSGEIILSVGYVSVRWSDVTFVHVRENPDFDPNTVDK